MSADETRDESVSSQAGDLIELNRSCKHLWLKLFGKGNVCEIKIC